MLNVMCRFSDRFARHHAGGTHSSEAASRPGEVGRPGDGEGRGAAYGPSGGRGGRARSGRGSSSSAAGS
jgi:hypothetical protein